VSYKVVCETSITDFSNLTLFNMKPESDVSDLDKLVNLQSDHHQALRSTLQNIRKDSQARKTKICLKKWLDQVEELRNAFRETKSVSREFASRSLLL